MSAIVWHYTYDQAFSKIVADGAIRPATAHIAASEQPIVWFSANPHWEETAYKGLKQRDGSIRDLGMREMLDAGIRLFRIAVLAETAPLNWRQLRERSGMPEQVARGLVRAAKRRGARTSEWSGTFDAVPRDKWVAVEEFRDGQWVRLETSGTRTL